MMRIMTLIFVTVMMYIPLQADDWQRNQRNVDLARIGSDTRANDQQYDLGRRRIDAEASSRKWEGLGRLSETAVHRGADVLIWGRQAQRDENVAGIWADRDKTVNRDDRIVDIERDRNQTCREFERENPGYVCRWEGDRKVIEPIPRHASSQPPKTANCTNCGSTKPRSTF